MSAVLAHAAHAAPAAGWLAPLLVGGALAGAYLAALAARRPTLPRWRRRRTAAFLIGAALAATALVPALSHDPGPRAHMAQHLLLGMAAPVGLVLGAPVTLLLGSLDPVRARRLAALLRARPVRVLTHPAVAAGLHVGSLFLLYLTPVYSVALANPLVHRLLAVHFLLAGLLFTWSVGGQDPAPHRPRTAVRVAVLVVAGGAHAWLAKLLYAWAGELAAAHGGAVGQWEDAARWMYYGGDGYELVLAVVILAGWYRRGVRTRPGEAQPSPGTRTIPS